MGGGGQHGILLVRVDLLNKDGELIEGLTSTS